MTPFLKKLVVLASVAVLFLVPCSEAAAALSNSIPDNDTTASACCLQCHMSSHMF
jgi:hypothetical protein